MSSYLLKTYFHILSGFRGDNFPGTVIKKKYIYFF